MNGIRFTRALYDKQTDDFARSSNCLHAAMVEMKTKGAKYYWMKGQATVPLKLVLS